MGKSIISTGPFSIAKLLVYQRVEWNDRGILNTFQLTLVDPGWPVTKASRLHRSLHRNDGVLICFNGVSTIMDIEYSAI